jgi:hypothetical protein
MDSPLPLRSPAVSLRSLLRRGIGALVHDRGANATRDFSAPAGAFRSGHSAVIGLRPSPRNSAQESWVSRSERLSTLPGDVPSDAPSWGALPFPIHGQRKAVYSETLQGVVQKSEIAAGRSIGPSRRLITNRTARTAHTAAEPHSRTLTGV